MAKWTPERDALALKLCDEGLSFTAIATVLGGFEGYSEGGRLAVSGRVWRLTSPKYSDTLKRAPMAAMCVRRERDVDAMEVLAAAIVADGGSYAEAEQETGLSPKEVRRAVSRSRVRENHEIRDQGKRNVLTAWGTLGEARDARS
jgi:hypothetical protein